MLLANKNAVIYGAGGAIGGAVARAFAREGARVFLAGRTQATLDTVAQHITAAGGAAEVAQVDAFDEQAVEGHARSIAAKAGRLDISFNAVGIEDFQGTALAEMSLASFIQPITLAMQTQFLTARAVAPHMVRQGSGVIMTITAGPARVGTPLVGGFGAMCAAIEGFARQLAAELGPQGVRVVCLRSAGSPESPGLDEVFTLNAQNAGMTRADLEASYAAGIPLRRFPRLAEVGNVAAILASDLASPMTGTIGNITCGATVD